MVLEHIYPNEEWKETMKYIDKNRNWNVPTQSYRFPNLNRKIPIAECKIYKRGQYIIAEIKENGVVDYWEHEHPTYNYLQQAILLMCLDVPKKWKTLNRLTAFRQAIRQTEVNLCGYVDDILEDVIEGKAITFKLYQEFMRAARSQDLQHHGNHTF